MRFPTNHDIAWSYEDHCYERIYYYSPMHPYLKAFEKERKKAKKVAAA